LLPNLGSIGEKTRVMKEDKEFTHPHRAKPAGFVSSFIRMSYYWLDYILGVLLLIRKDVQYGNYTIFDRYIYDFLIDPRRSRIGLPFWLRKAFTRLVPQPRLVFILLTDANIIYARKQELALEEIKRQIKAYKTLAGTHQRFVILDASKAPEVLVDEAMRIITEKFTTRLV
jgi:thymidylate kinase